MYPFQIINDYTIILYIYKKKVSSGLQIHVSPKNKQKRENTSLTVKVTIIIDWTHFIKFIEHLYKNKLKGFKTIENYFC